MQLQDLVRDYGRTLVEALVGCCFLAATWAAKRTQRWLVELLDRERLAYERALAEHRSSEIQRHNETLRTLSEASESAERVTLESLLDNAERDFSLESSRSRFDPPSRGAAPLDLSRPREVSMQPADWSDDEEVTTVPATPASLHSRAPRSDPPRT